MTAYTEFLINGLGQFDDKIQGLFNSEEYEAQNVVYYALGILENGNDYSAEYARTQIIESIGERMYTYLDSRGMTTEQADNFGSYTDKQIAVASLYVILDNA